jgi:hypothetical protein
MRKFVSIAGLICIALVLAGCSVKIADKENKTFAASAFEKKTGEIAVLSTSIPSPKLPVIFDIGFEKTEGKLSVILEDPNGAEVFTDTLKASNADKSVPLETREKWGNYHFDKVMELAGKYTMKVLGENATGTIEATLYQDSVYMTKFTGIAVQISKEVTDTSKELGILVGAQPTADSAGLFTAKIIDPEGKEIKNTRLTPTKDFPNPYLNFFEKPAKKGVYTAIIEAKDATGSATGYFFDQEPIDFSAFVKPVLLILLGVAFYLMIKSKDRKVMVWGGMFWLIASILTNLGISFLVSKLFANVPGNYGFLVQNVTNTISLSIIGVLLMFFQKFIAEIKKCSPTELVAFAFGFVFINPIITGINGLTLISQANENIVHSYRILTVPGNYISTEHAIFDIGTSLVSMIASCLITFTALIIFLWVLRQKEQIKPTTLWLAVIGAVVLKIVGDFALFYSNQATALYVLGNPTTVFKLTFGFASPMVESLIFTGILCVIGALVIVNWKKIMGLALKACPVTIDDLTHKEA